MDLVFVCWCRLYICYSRRFATASFCYRSQSNALCNNGGKRHLVVLEYKHVGTWVSSAASPQRDISHKVAGATTGYLQAVSTVFSKKQYTRELRIRAIQALVESRLLSNAGGWADVTLGVVGSLPTTTCRRSWEHCHPQLLNPKLGSACGKLTQSPGNSCFARS